MSSIFIKEKKNVCTYSQIYIAGDPYIFHSLYVVVCLPPTKKIQGLDIVVYGRLGNQVKKTVVLASLNDQGQVEYISLEYVPETSR